MNSGNSSNITALTGLDQPTGLTPEQELAFIRKVIVDSRRSIVEDGRPYIAWGLIVAVAMLISYLSALLDTDFGVGWIWLGLVALGLGYTLYYGWKQKRTEVEEVKTFAGKLQGAIWGACGTSLGISIVLIMAGYSETRPSIPPILTCSVVSFFLAIGYYLSGVVLEIKWLRNIAFAWWAGAIVMYFWNSVHVLAMYAGMILVFQVLPGIILNRKYRAAMSEPAAVRTA